MSKKKSFKDNTIFIVFVTAIVTAVGTSMVQNWLPAITKFAYEKLTTEPILWIELKNENNEPMQNINITAFYPGPMEDASGPIYKAKTDIYGRVRLDNAQEGHIQINMEFAEGKLIKIASEIKKIEKIPNTIRLSGLAWITKKVEISSVESEDEGLESIDEKSITIVAKKNGSLPWMSIALSEIGTQEVEGPGDNPRIVEYLKTTSLPNSLHKDETPWNSAFINSVISEAGLKGTNSAKARSWLDWGVAIDKPRVGCIAIFSRGSSPWTGHVAFFIRNEGNMMWVLGGNQRNKVSLTRISASRLLGCRWPK